MPQSPWAHDRVPIGLRLDYPGKLTVFQPPIILEPPSSQNDAGNQQPKQQPGETPAGGNKWVGHGQRLTATLAHQPATTCPSQETPNTVAPTLYSWPVLESRQLCPTLILRIAGNAHSWLTLTDTLVQAISSLGRSCADTRPHHNHTELAEQDCTT